MGKKTEKSNKYNNMIIFGIMIILIVVIVWVGFSTITQKETKAGYGWSVKESLNAAVEEASLLLKESVSDPDYIMLFSTAGYDSDSILSEINSIFPKAKVYGGTSSTGVLTNDGYHTSKTGSLALLGISSNRMTFGVGGADLDNFENARDAGKDAIENAIENAGKTDELPKLILITVAPGNEEEVLLGIEDVIGWGIPVIGGSSGDDDLTGKWHQYDNNRIYSNGVSLTAIFTDLDVRFIYEAGYEKSKTQGTITKAEGRTIYEIDGRPAGEVYNEWCEGCITKELANGGTILSQSTFWPFAKIIEREYDIYYLSLHPLSVDGNDKSLTLFANVMRGDKLLIMHGDWELLLNRAKTTPHKLMDNKELINKKPLFGIYTFCGGSLLGIPEDQRFRLSGFVNEELNGIPFIGTFTFGEQGPLGIVNHHGNLANSLILFSEEN